MDITGLYMLSTEIGGQRHSSSSQLKQQKLANTRAERESTLTLTVVNPNIRIASGLYILDMEAKMGHHGIPNPYRRLSYPVRPRSWVPS